MTDHVGSGWSPITSSRNRARNKWNMLGGVGGGGGGGAGWDWQDPPTRSNTVYHSNVGGSVQNAVNSISSDTMLVLDNGPYTTNLNIPNTDRITISGGSSGATINSPNNRLSHVSGGGWSTTDTSCSSINEGDTVLSVGNASIFSPGDDLLIHDQSDLYKGMGSNDLRNTHTQYKGEFRVVASVDTAADTVTLTSGTHQHYNNPNGVLEARNVNWSIEDFHWHNITLDGGVSNPNENTSSNDDYRGLSLNRSKYIWITDSTFRNYHKDGCANNANLHQFIDNCYVTNYDRYGLSHSDGLTHGRVRNCLFEDMHSYGIQAGGGATGKKSVPAPTYDIMGLNCHVDNTMRSEFTQLGDAHFASERVEYQNCSSAGSAGMKIRGFDQHLIGGNYDCGGSSFTQTTQIVGQSSLRDLYCANGNRGWYIWPKEGHTMTDLTMAECQFENMSGTPFHFRDDANGVPAKVKNLQVINSSWNGSWIDDAMVEDSSGNGTQNVTYSTTYPTNQTPAEYFA